MELQELVDAVKSDKPQRCWVRTYDLIRDVYWWVLVDDTSGFPESVDRISEADMPDSALAHKETTPKGREVIQEKFVRANGKKETVAD